MKKTDQLNYKNELSALLVMCLSALLVCFLIGALVSNEVLPESFGTVAASVAVDVVVLIVCYVTSKKKTQQRFLTAVILAAIFCGIRLLVGMIFNTDTITRLLPCLITIAAGAVGGIWANTKKKRRR